MSLSLNSLLFTNETLREWLLPELSREKAEKLIKIISTNQKTYYYSITSVIQALAKLSLEFSSNSKDLEVIQGFYLKFSFFNGNYKLITRLVGEGLVFQTYQLASRLILGEKIDLGHETSQLISALTESIDPISISHSSFILIIILSLKGYFESAKNILYLCLDKMNVLEAEYRNLSKNPSLMLYQFSWLYLLSYTDPEGSVDLLDEIMETIDQKIKSRDPVFRLLKLWSRLILLDKTVIDEVKQIIESPENEFQFLIALIESQLYRNLSVYPNEFNFSTPNNRYPEFFSGIIKIDYALTAWITGKDQNVLNELIMDSIEVSRKLYLYYPLIKGYIIYAINIALERPKKRSKALFNDNLQYLLEIKHILFAMEETKENNNFLLFLQFLFIYLHWIRTGSIDESIKIENPISEENPLSFFYEIIQIIISNDYKVISKKLRKLRRSTIYIISPAIQRFHTLFALEIKLKELGNLDKEKITRFHTYINFLVSENHDLEEEDHIDYLLELFQSIKVYKDKSIWIKKNEQLFDLLTLGEPFYVFKEIKEYLKASYSNDMPFTPFTPLKESHLIHWLHIMQVWSLINYLEMSVPSYFLVTPSWESLENTRSKYYYDDEDLEDQDDLFGEFDDEFDDSEEFLD